MPHNAPRRGWTEDTSTAFLLALRLTGGIRTAAAEIGRHVTTCYKARGCDAGFAAAWDRIVAEQKAARRVVVRRPDAIAASPSASGVVGEPGVKAGIMNKRTRWDGITPVKRKAFLRALSETGTVAAACLAADVSDTAVYRLRRDDADFGGAWDRALRTAAPALEQAVWERAVEGWDEPVFAGGKQVGTRRRFSESLLRQLVIRRERAVATAADPTALHERAIAAARAAGGSFITRETEQASRAKLAVKLDGLLRRREARDFAAAEEAGLFAAAWMIAQGHGPATLSEVTTSSDGWAAPPLATSSDGWAAPTRWPTWRGSD